MIDPKDVFIGIPNEDSFVDTLAAAVHRRLDRQFAAARDYFTMLPRKVALA
jgi:hypothetical protein